ncbi:MAG: AMP-binding protein [Deltaproteobacteria bacterium]|nr:AMP-binding protein [Deltaproteobacteria bacterium]
MGETDAWEKPDNLVELWEASVARHPDCRLFGTTAADGAFRWVTNREVAARVDHGRGGLARLGVGVGDAVGLVSANRVEWAVVAFATFGLGARLVPMYETDLAKTWHNLATDAGVKVLFAPTQAFLDQLRDLQQEAPGLGALVALEGTGDGSLAALEQRGCEAPVGSIRPAPGDVAILIYTSGTTTAPKGVLLSHGNLTSNVHSGLRLFPSLNERSASLSILPWAHIFGQTAELYIAVHLGSGVAFATSPESVADDLKLVKPTQLLGVPRLLIRIHEAIVSRVAAAGGLRERLFAAALRANRARRETGRSGLKQRILDRLVMTKVRAQLGGRLEFVISGSATLDVEVATFFHDLGIPVYDCYGLTETSPGVTMNCPSAYKIGTVGKPIDRVRVEIDRSRTDDNTDEGEIIVYGPNVMLGYHNKPEATAAAMTPDGGLRTGDRGRLDEGGFLHVTGRFKEQFKLQNGKFVFPAVVEEALELVPYVSSAMVLGESRPYATAVISLDLDKLGDHSARLGLTVAWRAFVGDMSSLSRDIHAAITRDLEARLEPKFDAYEIPRRYLFVKEPFSTANGLLTQTLKVRRQAVLKKYRADLERLYKEDRPLTMPDAT